MVAVPDAPTPRLCYLLHALCLQVTCDGPELEVIKRDKFWGQGDTVLGPAAGPGDYSMPLGELEFLLDSKRKQQ